MRNIYFIKMLLTFSLTGVLLKHDVYLHFVFRSPTMSSSRSSGKEDTEPFIRHGMSAPTMRYGKVTCAAFKGKGDSCWWRFKIYIYNIYSTWTCKCEFTIEERVNLYEILQFKHESEHEPAVYKTSFGFEFVPITRSHTRGRSSLNGETPSIFHSVRPSVRQKRRRRTFPCLIIMGLL